ncbi:MAG: FAD-dependent oxidoreductase [bacterium]|nr:FAD-dependent oxidoreductase [bacterium]
MEVTKNLYDVIVIGGGPAGLSAAIYAARAKYRVLVLEKEHFGGQITITSEVVNYPGVECSSGKELTQTMKRQAEAFGAEFAVAEVLNMDLEGEVKTLYTTVGEQKALGVVLATGANPRKLGFQGEKEFQGRGVAYCATCDGEFFTGLEVFVIGGGFAAVEEGIFLTKYARKVTMIVREEAFTCAASVAEKVWQEPKIEVKFQTEILEAGGDSMVSYARFRNNRTGEEWRVDAAEEDGCFGIFVFAGYVPNTAWMDGKVACNPQGYLITDANQKTNLDGVYGAGDVCIKNLRQVVTAVSDGAIAATSLEKYVSEMHSKLQLPELIQKEGEKRSHSKKEEGTKPEKEQETHGFLSEDIKKQLAGLFPKFERKVKIEAELDGTALAGEMKGFLGELSGLSDKLICETRQLTEEEKKQREAEGEIFPALRIFREDGSGGNLIFHGVPGGHEFNSFVIALYNMAGSGQAVDAEIAKRVEDISQSINVKVMVSLSCTMCPEVVMGTQRIAALNDKVTAEMLDLMHYPEWKQKYKIMSVPCMVINDKEVLFGKKNLEEISKILQQVSS